MKAIIIRDCGTTQYYEAESISIDVSDKGGYTHVQYSNLTTAVRNRGLIELTEDDVEEFLEGSGYAPTPSVRAGLEAIGFKVAPDYDETTATALISAIWGISVPNEAGEAGRILARRLAKAGKKIVDVES